MTAKRRNRSEHLSFVMVGHVDHGKSTLIGRILYDTGALAADKIAGLDRLADSSGKRDFSLLLDHFEEERRDAMTLDTTQVFFETPNRCYTLVDAPGHAGLMKNMITGAAAAAAAVLVVDVTRGLEEQTLRHAQTLDLLKLDPVIVVVNKMDLLGYGETEFRTVLDSVHDLFSRLSIKFVDCIPVSSTNGDNVAARSPQMAWYKGPTLLEALEILDPAVGGSDRKTFIFPVQDILEKDEQVILLGRVENGSIGQGDVVKILPENRMASIGALLHFEGSLRHASQGQSIGLVLQDGIPVRRGDILCDLEAGTICGKRFIAKVLCFSRDGLKKGERLTLRCVTEEVQVLVESIRMRIDPETLVSVPSESGRLEDLEMGEILFQADRPVVIAPFTSLPALGRFVLYQGDVFHSVGLVIEIFRNEKD